MPPEQRQQREIGERNAEISLVLFVPEGNFCPLRHVLTFWILIFPHARTVPCLSETFLKDKYVSGNIDIRTIAGWIRNVIREEKIR